MKTALYARVSTSDKGQTCETQLHALREFCKARDWSIVQEYSDTGISGSKERRPQLDALMKDAKRRKFDAVLVYKLDRFGRSTRHLLNSLAEFDSLGLAFVSYSDSWDTSTPSGKLMFTMLAAMAEFERSLIMERVNSGIKRAKAAGIHCGRRKGAGQTFVDIPAVRARMTAGESLRGVARSLAVSPALLSKRLKGV